MKKKNSFGIVERFPTKCKQYFFPFSFSIENEEIINPPPFAPHFGGVLVPLAPQKFGTQCMPPFLKTLFEQKTEI